MKSPIPISRVANNPNPAVLDRPTRNGRRVRDPAVFRFAFAPVFDPVVAPLLLAAPSAFVPLAFVPLAFDTAFAFGAPLTFALADDAVLPGDAVVAFCVADAFAGGFRDEAGTGDAPVAAILVFEAVLVAILVAVLVDGTLGMDCAYSLMSSRRVTTVAHRWRKALHAGSNDGPDDFGNTTIRKPWQVTITTC
jgi:hypothetical protein